MRLSMTSFSTKLKILGAFSIMNRHRIRHIAAVQSSRRISRATTGLESPVPNSWPQDSADGEEGQNARLITTSSDNLSWDAPVCRRKTNRSNITFPRPGQGDVWTQRMTHIDIQRCSAHCSWRVLLKKVRIFISQFWWMKRLEKLLVTKRCFHHLINDNYRLKWHTRKYSFTNRANNFVSASSEQDIVLFLAIPSELGNNNVIFSHKCQIVASTFGLYYKTLFPIIKEYPAHFSSARNKLGKYQVKGRW